MTAGERNAHNFLSDHVEGYGLDCVFVAMKEVLRETAREPRHKLSRANLKRAIGKLETIRTILRDVDTRAGG